MIFDSNNEQITEYEYHPATRLTLLAPQGYVHCNDIYIHLYPTRSPERQTGPRYAISSSKSPAGVSAAAD